MKKSRSLDGGVLAFVLLFGFSILLGFPAVPGLDSPLWQDILLDEDETDPLESKLSLAIPDGQPALPSSCQAVVPSCTFRPLAESAPRPLLQTLVFAQASPRAPPAA